MRGLSVSRCISPEIKRKGIGQRQKPLSQTKIFKNIIVKQ